MRSHCLFKEGFGNRSSTASLMRRLNVLLFVARTFVFLESLVSDKIKRVILKE